jgi:hypothetical protein
MDTQVQAEVQVALQDAARLLYAEACSHADPEDRWELEEAISRCENLAEEIATHGAAIAGRVALGRVVA